MSYTYVKNVFEIKDKHTNKVEEFIKITTVDEFALYELITKIQLLKYENFYSYNDTFAVENITNGDTDQLNSDLVRVIADYSFLGDITFKINKDISKKSIYIDLNIALNKKIHELLSLSKSIEIGYRR